MPLCYQHWSEKLDPLVCVSVDGDAPGRLHLSHWPGNHTPETLRHDLSTGMCLNLMRSPDRQDWLAGLEVVTNNHWDTDGALSVFTLLEPDLALAHAPVLIAAAMAGDFSVFTTPEGVMLDLTLTALTRREDSPVFSGRFADEWPRRQAQYEEATRLIPELLKQPQRHMAWIEPELTRIRADLRALREEEADLRVVPRLEFAALVAEREFHDTAVNTAAGVDRILAVTRAGAGWRYRLRLTTRSWFDLRARPDRPDWTPLLNLLNESGNQDGQWRADSLLEPTPCLEFVDGSGAPAVSSLPPDEVEALVTRHFAAARGRNGKAQDRPGAAP
jgi:hypothetical protein